MAQLRIISTVFLLLWLNSPALAVFYRNIPFRLKSTNDEVAVSSGEQGKYGHESIREILDQIEDEAQLIAGERNAAAEPAAAPRRIVRLIPIRSNELDELEVLGKDKENMMAAKGRKKVPTASLNSHLMALRPDYAFRNVANFLRSFFDSRIERHSRKLDGQQNSS